jgi:hypothetical protein
LRAQGPTVTTAKRKALLYLGATPPPAFVLAYAPHVRTTLAPAFDIAVAYADRAYLNECLDESHFELILDLSYELDVPATSRKFAANTSRVYFGTAISAALAVELADAVYDWGTCCAFGHRGTRPASRFELRRGPSRKALYALAVQPFDLAGPDPELYRPHARALGETIGGTIVSHFTAPT